MKRLIPTLMALAAPAMLLAQDASTDLSQSDIDEQNALSNPNSIECSEDSIADWELAVRKKFGLARWGTADGKIFHFASQNVAVPITDPNFAGGLANAFAMAASQTQREIARLRFGHNSIQEIRQFYQDNSTNNRQIDLEIPAEESTVAQKALVLLDSLDLGGTKLDRALVALGADAAKTKNMPETKRKDLFKELFLTKQLTAAAGEVAGIVTLQSAVRVDKQGNATIGLVSVWSPKTLQVARDIAFQRKSLVRGKGIDLETMIPTGLDDLLGNWGVRLVYDAEGAPCLVSFAVAAYAPDGDDAFINSSRKKEAYNAAVKAAEKQISTTVTGQMSFRDSQETGQLVHRFVEREMAEGSLTSEKTEKNMLDVVTEVSTLTAGMELQGISELHKQFFRIPSGQEFWAVALVWKYSTLAAMKEINQEPLDSTDVATPRKPTDDRDNSGKFDGRAFNTLEDF